MSAPAATQKQPVNAQGGELRSGWPQRSLPVPLQTPRSPLRLRSGDQAFLPFHVFALAPFFFFLRTCASGCAVGQVRRQPPRF